MRRSDRDKKTYFRSQRIFCTNGQWYFATREGEHGPYGSRSRAETALATFVNEKIELDGFQQSRGRSTKAGLPRWSARATIEYVDAVPAALKKPLIY